MQCSHYHRRCRIRAPCGNEIFDCRHCHNEPKNNISVDKRDRHDIPRHQIRQVICSLCRTEQEVQQVCVNCGVCLGKYFVTLAASLMMIYLRDSIIAMAVAFAGSEGVRTSSTATSVNEGCCYSILRKNSHLCMEGATHYDCPVCFEFLFESRSDTTVMPCGHTFHTNCLEEMSDHYRYACLLCSKLVCDMSMVREKYDMGIAATPMPEPYQNKLVWILCNDCGKTSEVSFHFVAQKCLNCKSYNTGQIRG